MTVDLRSVAGKTFETSGHAPLLVVGAGVAGLAAAIEAAKAGLSVTLIDENPVPFETMAESIPLFFGNRMGGAIKNRNAMMEAMLEASPELATAFDLGVDIRLGTACWGLFSNMHNLHSLAKPIAGLASHDEGTSLISFDQAIVATGRRDMGLAFPGWDQPGVLGAEAALTLAIKYKALEGQRAVVVGSTAEAMLTALALIEAGVEIDCLIEQHHAPIGPADLLERLQALGVQVKCDTVIRSVETDENGVRAVTLRHGQCVCDLVVLAIGAVPMVDLLASAGAKLAFQPALGGFVPVLDPCMTTSFAHIKAVGDCAGLWPAKSQNPDIAAMEGRKAVTSFMQGSAPFWAPPEMADYDLSAYRKDWVRKSVVEAEGAAHVCLCEEVDAREILGVKPPRYLNWTETRNEERSLCDILGDGPPNPDQIKRLTRAGMGPCQGRRCREQIQALLALEQDLPVSAIPLAGYRAPVRPMTLKSAVPAQEDAELAAQWDSWFGMPRQWVPFWDVEETYTVQSLARETDHVSE